MIEGFISGITIAGAGPVGPLALTGLIGWWDVSVFASLSLAGAVVNSVADQSGAGNNLTGIASPTYDATVFNGRPGIVCAPGPVEYLANTSFPLGTGSTLTAFAVLYRAGGNNFARYISYTKAGGSHDFDNTGSFFVARNAGLDGVIAGYNNTQVTSSGTDFPVGSYRRLIFTVKSDGTVTIYINGTATSTALALPAWVTNGYLAFLGSEFEAASSVISSGYFAESGIATSYSDATTVASLDTYLKNKWGL